MITLELSSGSRRLRPLGLGDIDFAIDLFQAVITTGEACVLLHQLRRANLSDPEDLVQVLLAGWKVARAPVQAWAASLLDMTIEDIADPEKFDLEDLARLIEGLKDHPNAKGFFARLSRALTGPLLRWMQTLSPEPALST